jgi:uncharacterized protein (TIGR00375 family)
VRFIADLHIHSRHSIATSSEMSPEGIWKWAQLKGVKVTGTGDAAHPQWVGELNEKLDSAGNGLFTLRGEYRTREVPSSCRSEVFFLLSAEISCVYSKGGKTRKIHILVLIPDFASAARIRVALSKIGNLTANGRPVLRLDAKELLKIVINASPDAVFVPAHAWTPHFSVFGAGSGFDSLDECFEEMTPYIYAIETGLSSDPPMNWRLSNLDGIRLISNSDAQSPEKIGREATVFDTEISYGAITSAIRTGKGFAGTIEFFPEEGKYHYDGHRACGICLSPKETTARNLLCPICGKRVTVGVMHRIERLADRKEGFVQKDPPSFYSIIPLAEIIAEILGSGVKSKGVRLEYMKLLESLGNEFAVLLGIAPDDIERVGSAILREAVLRMREGKVHISPGFDGQYGKVRIFDEVGRKKRPERGRPEGSVLR